MVAGRMEKLMAMGCAQVPRDRVNTQDLGITVLRFLEFTPGQVGVSMRVTGKMARDMGLVLRAEENGSTEENGHKGLREDMGSDSQHQHQQNMKEHGQMDFKMVMVQKLMQMEVHIKASGYEA